MAPSKPEIPGKEKENEAAAPPRIRVAIGVRIRENKSMSDHVYKKIQLVGSSPDSIEKAVENALTRASKTIRNMRWFEVVETRGHIEEGKIAHWQVTILIGFTVED